MGTAFLQVMLPQLGLEGGLVLSHRRLVVPVGQGLRTAWWPSFPFLTLGQGGQLLSGKGAERVPGGTGLAL